MNRDAPTHYTYERLCNLQLALRFCLAAIVLAFTTALRGDEPSAASPGPLAGAKVLDIGSRKQLFMDGRFIAKSSGVALVVNPPVKKETITLPTPVASYVNGIVEHEGRFLMYYGSPGGYAVATSTDGLAWKCPDPAVVFPGCCEGGVFLDPKDTEGFPLKAIFGILPSATTTWGKNLVGWAVPDLPPLDGRTKPEISGGLYLFRSKDGLHWECVPKVALPFVCDTANQVFYDSRLDRYVAYLRGFPMKLDSPHRYKRVAVRTDTANLMDMPWPFRRNPGRPVSPNGCYSYPEDEMEVVLAADAKDAPRTDLYNPCVHLYPYAQDAYLAFPSMFRTYGYGQRENSHGRDFRGKSDGDGQFEVHLAVSRDGIRFERFRTPYLKPGLVSDRYGIDGDPDCGLPIMGIGMIRRGDELYQYYVGSRRTHIGEQTARDRGIRGEDRVFRIVQRLDGFVSADAGSEGGEILTPPVIFSGNRLVLNADCGGMGEIWVELQDAQGVSIPGFARADAVSVDRNGTAQEVWWKQGPDVSSLAGRPVQLRFVMRSAKLFAFHFITSN